MLVISTNRFEFFIEPATTPVISCIMVCERYQWCDYTLSYGEADDTVLWAILLERCTVFVNTRLSMKQSSRSNDPPRCHRWGSTPSVRSQHDPRDIVGNRKCAKAKNVAHWPDHPFHAVVQVIWHKRRERRNIGHNAFSRVPTI